jgi:hypothetical protein
MSQVTKDFSAHPMAIPRGGTPGGSAFWQHQLGAKWLGTKGKTAGVTWFTHPIAKDRYRHRRDARGGTDV